MGKLDCQFVFTKYGEVVKIRNDETVSDPVPVSKFLKDLEKSIKSGDSFVLFNYEKKEFSIKIDNDCEWAVVLTNDEEENLLKGKYTSLIKKLLYLAAKTKKNNDARILVSANQIIIGSILNASDISKLSTDELDLYYIYLKNNVLNKTRNKEERKLVCATMYSLSMMIRRRKEEGQKSVSSQLVKSETLFDYASRLLDLIDSLDANIQRDVLNMITYVLDNYVKVEQDDKKNNIEEFIEQLNYIEKYIYSVLVDEDAIKGQLSQIIDSLSRGNK